MHMHEHDFGVRKTGAACLQMIVHPEERVADFAKAGSDIISVHAEPAATVHLDRTIQQVHACSKPHRHCISAASPSMRCLLPCHVKLA